jgi:hypothetical protein
MLKLIIQCTRFENNYSTFTARSRVKERRVKTGWNSVYHKNWCFSKFHPPLLNDNVTFCRFFFFSLTWFMTKLRVPVLCFCFPTLWISLMHKTLRWIFRASANFHTCAKHCHILLSSSHSTSQIHQTFMQKSYWASSYIRNQLQCMW